MIYANVCSIRDPLKQDLALEFYRKQNKYISILTETHIKHDQILHIRSNWLGPIFLSPGSSHTKGFIAELHPGLEGVTEVDIDPKGRFVSFKVTLSNNRVLCFLPLKGIKPESSWLKGVSLKDYKIAWKINVREIKTKIILGDFNITMDKMDRDGGNETCRSKVPGSILIQNLVTMPKLIT